MIQNKKLALILLNIILLHFTSLGGSPEHYPIPPKGPCHLFYVQRTQNRNTVVYEANFDVDGNLNPKDPIKIYWVMFEKGGITQELNRLERSFAFGVNYAPIKNHPQEYDIQLVAYKDMKLRLKQTAPYRAVVLKEKDSLPLPLNHIFVHAKDAGLLTRVEFLDVYTYHPENGKLNMEKISIK